jgi:hypothetical protein
LSLHFLGADLDSLPDLFEVRSFLRQPDIGLVVGKSIPEPLGIEENVTEIEMGLGMGRMQGDGALQ